LLNKVVFVPLATEARLNTKGIVQVMSKVSLKEGEIKGMKGSIEKLK
jgi:hypothetical protein